MCPPCSWSRARSSGGVPEPVPGATEDGQLSQSGKPGTTRTAAGSVWANWKLRATMSDFAEIAYESAQRALDKQEKVLEELRARTGILLAASSLAASLFGGKALDISHPIGVAVAALAAFMTSLAACLYVLVPRQRFVFALKGPAIYEELYEFRDDLAEVHRRLAYDLQRFWDENDDALHPIRQAFNLAAAGLALEVTALAVLTSGIL
jgi:hypothetical protein